MYKSVELFYDPRKELSTEISFPAGEPEMSEFDSAFLCGMLKEFKPTKILEIGVAGGGTTAIIQQCVSMMGISAFFRSVDLAVEQSYDGEKHEVGFIAKKARETIPVLKKVDWKLYTGKIAPELMDEIGGNIDFLILDTAHVLPGEMFDFLALLPYMNKGGVVVFHDLSNNWSSSDRNHYAFRTVLRDMADATMTIFSTVSGEKYYMEDKSALQRGKRPNIGAIQITDDTYEKIADCFAALSHTWYYMPPKEQLEQYKMSIFNSSIYNEECKWLFESAVKINANILQADYPWSKNLLKRIKRAGRVLLKGN